MEDKIKAKKSLGQNFLKSGKAIFDIVQAASLSPADVVVEIGPGKGILTEALLKKAGRVIAVEKDDRLVGYLEEKFSNEIKSERLKLAHGDILEFDPTLYGLSTGHYVLVGNIPYYITGLIFRKFLEGDTRPSRIVLTVQKEVAERIVARDGKESVLSVSVKIFGRPKLVKKISASSFSPKPKVDSAVLLVEKISSPFKSSAESKKFFEVLKKGFAHKRKLLKRNLGVENEELLACGINPAARPEELGTEKWLCLSGRI